jgi:hypothetical protein
MPANISVDASRLPILPMKFSSFITFVYKSEGASSTNLHLHHHHHQQHQYQEQDLSHFLASTSL